MINYFLLMVTIEVEIGYARAEKAMRMTRDEIDESVKTMYANMKNTLL